MALIYNCHMKKILCYGDSNTWGYISGTDGERYDETIRYPKVLQSLLGDSFEVIEEGLPSRTCGVDDIHNAIGNKNGSAFFGQAVYTHSPLDYVLVMLGTNDMKVEFDRTAKDCAIDLENKYIIPLNNRLGGKIKQIPKIIIVSPPIIDKGSWGKYENADKKSMQFDEEYKKIAEKYNCNFVSNEGLKCGIDKVHLTKESHKLLAEKIKDILKKYEKICY